MLRRINIIIIAAILLFSLSINSLAIGNSYTFTSSWFRILFDNAIISNNTSTPSYTTYGGVIALNGIVYNADSNYNSTAVWLKTDSSTSAGTVSVTIPLNVSMYTSVEYLDLEFFTVFSNSVQFQSATVRVGNSNYSVTSNVTDLDNTSFGHIDLPTPSATLGTFVSDFTGRGQRINLRYFKNLSTSEQVIDSITLNFTSTGSAFALGVPCTNSIVNLPDSFYDAIYSIKIFERLRYNQGLELQESIDNIQSQLDEIIGKVGSSTSEQNNYYNTIINQDPEQAEKLAALQSELEQAKQDLADFQEKFNSYTSPDPDEVLPDEDVSQTTIDMINNEDTAAVFGLLFGNELFLSILVISISVATIGYILYGKRA